MIRVDGGLKGGLEGDKEVLESVLEVLEVLEGDKEVFESVSGLASGLIEGIRSYR